MKSKDKTLQKGFVSGQHNCQKGSDDWKGKYHPVWSSNRLPKREGSLDVGLAQFLICTCVVPMDDFGN